MSVMTKQFESVEIDTSETISFPEEILSLGVPGISLEIKFDVNAPVDDGTYPKSSPRAVLSIVIYWHGRELNSIPASKFLSADALKERIETEIDKARERIKTEMEDKKRELEELQKQAEHLGLS